MKFIVKVSFGSNELPAPPVRTTSIVPETTDPENLEDIAGLGVIEMVLVMVNPVGISILTDPNRAFDPVGGAVVLFVITIEYGCDDEAQTGVGLIDAVKSKASVKVVSAVSPEDTPVAVTKNVTPK